MERRRGILIFSLPRLSRIPPTSVNIRLAHMKHRFSSRIFRLIIYIYSRLKFHPVRRFAIVYTKHLRLKKEKSRVSRSVKFDTAVACFLRYSYTSGRRLVVRGKKRYRDTSRVSDERIYRSNFLQSVAACVGIQVSRTVGERDRETMRALIRTVNRTEKNNKEETRKSSNKS